MQFQIQSLTVLAGESKNIYVDSQSVIIKEWMTEGENKEELNRQQ